mgnify:CR=1 FL=1
MAQQIRVLQVGMGPIGARVTQYLTQRGGSEIVGAVDVDPDKIGMDLAELAGVRHSVGVRIAGDVASALAGRSADVAVLTTTSSIEHIVPQIEELLPWGVHVVSTCEELSYPWKTHPDLADRLDQAARQCGVAILSTGVNPGFLMDLLPLVLTGICQDVQGITVERIQDARYRRLPGLPASCGADRVNAHDRGGHRLGAG